jgi:hypothetical protein
MPSASPGQLDQISAAIGALHAHVEIIRESGLRQERQTAEILSRLDDMHERVKMVESTKKTVDGLAPTIARIEKIEQRVIGAATLATFVGGIVMAALLKFQDAVAWLRRTLA